MRTSLALPLSSACFPSSKIKCFLVGEGPVWHRAGRRWPGPVGRHIEADRAVQGRGGWRRAQPSEGKRCRVKVAGRRIDAVGQRVEATRQTRLAAELRAGRGCENYSAGGCGHLKMKCLGWRGVGRAGRFCAPSMKLYLRWLTLVHLSINR
jgi:hypothetical protein